VRLTPGVAVEQPLRDRGAEAASFRPCRHGPRLLAADHGGVGEDRRAFGRGRDDVDILQNKMDFLGLRERQQADRPEIGLAEMAKADQPKARGQ
jgi:hypothetical protein